MRVRWTRRAERSLAAIADFIALDNPQAAHETISRIRRAAESLLLSPKLGRPGRVEGTRELVVTPNYILPYRIKGGEVQILHVFHARRRWPGSF
ncbi:MAG: type II toxin-antitoxin system RelE/ParE family toxin [Acidobacteria bacterium]|nr:type II toxin-antitoxin system RelE/ParE family toxin [Acidobacteriota bacterium]